MTTKQRTSLGRNLSVLLSSSTLLQTEPTEDAEFKRVEMTQLTPSPYQPRREFDDDSLAELAASIKQQGVLQPLIVRKLDEQQFEILAGERRWRAAQLAELTEVPVIIKKVDNETAMAIALVENLQREDLNSLDQAHAMQRLISECDLTHQQVADLLGKSRTAVSNFVRLLSLSEEVKQRLQQRLLDMGHARALLTLSHEKQAEVATLIVAKQLSVRETEQLIQRLHHKAINPAAVSNDELKTNHFTALLQAEAHRLTQQFNTKVQIQQKKSGKGSVTIHFNSPEAFEKILKQLG